MDDLWQAARHLSAAIGSDIFSRSIYKATGDEDAVEKKNIQIEKMTKQLETMIELLERKRKRNANV